VENSRSTTPVTPDQVAAGHAFYTERSLAVYDVAILGFFSRIAWRCPSSVILAHYDAHITSNHLDVGVGTGFFVDRCRHPPGDPRVGLMDANEACLAVAAHRLCRYDPELFAADILQPIDLDAPGFDSVGLNYVLHCLPGTIGSKAVVFDHLKAAANPGAVVFGATLLHGGVSRNWLARRVMARNNAHGVFSNTEDDLAGLTQALSMHLDDPTVECTGCVALFSGRFRGGRTEGAPNRDSKGESLIDDERTTRTP